MRSSQSASASRTLNVLFSKLIFSNPETIILEDYRVKIIILITHNTSTHTITYIIHILKLFFTNNFLQIFLFKNKKFLQDHHFAKILGKAKATYVRSDYYYYYY